ncbi:MAG TPA: hypothetical protein VFK05_29240 [Polyangiaceae bacterium]|nr:hypothetical protein [Polyangiaceae bacterium]
MNRDPSGAAGSGAGSGDGHPDGLAGGSVNSAGAAGLGGAGSRGIPACESPEPDPDDGLIVCHNGFEHRPETVTCSNGSGGTSNLGAVGEAGAEPGVLSPCRSDRDCSAGEACLCNVAAYPDYAELGALALCLPATCRTDPDCGASSWCALGRVNYHGEAILGFGCLHASDECTTDADCDSAAQPLCIDEHGRRVCRAAPI